MGRIEGTEAFQSWAVRGDGVVKLVIRKRCQTQGMGQRMSKRNGEECCWETAEGKKIHSREGERCSWRHV